MKYFYLLSYGHTNGSSHFGYVNQYAECTYNCLPQKVLKGLKDTLENEGYENLVLLNVCYLGAMEPEKFYEN